MDIPEYPEAPLGEGRDFYLHQLHMQSYYIFLTCARVRAILDDFLFRLSLAHRSVGESIDGHTKTAARVMRPDGCLVKGKTPSPRERVGVRCENLLHFLYILDVDDLVEAVCQFVEFFFYAVDSSHFNPVADTVCYDTEAHEPGDGSS